MREIPVTDVRAGDIARSNGKELRVAKVSGAGLIRCEGDGSPWMAFWREELALLGVTFWREDHPLPDYPGAVVISKDRHRVAVRACDRGENFAMWMTTARDRWKYDHELLEWLGPDWQEMTTPPAREWVPVDAGQVRDGDFVRFEWADGDAVEGFVSVDGDEHEVGAFDISLSAAEPGKWFKREEQTDASE